ncbi:MAG: decarboxylating NADP(+)-dependent phosphogluconate dehydrogenase [Bacteroidota bacterium]|nr:decarboxylating NADP(+)-dependent phosphogluconate dehydrogenase [Bacteroidota bacterium]
MTQAQAEIGVIGLAVMGQNLVLNMNDHGFTVAVHNRTLSKLEAFMAGPAHNRTILGARSPAEFVQLLRPPRRVMLMVKAGRPVDLAIESLMPLLSEGDIIIDGGNSNFQDTIRRTAEVEAQGLHYIGTGVSGGEEGARRGPSIMPGGSAAAWPYVKPVLQAIAAKVNGRPCCDWIGSNGAGHFVKMVHNGIEYGDMQIIAEAYQVMNELIGMDNDAISEVFGRWNNRKLKSYLIEITRDILAYKDADGAAVIDHILDSAGQKGTGKWTAAAALDAGIPLTLIGEAVMARFLSALTDERVEAANRLPGRGQKFDQTPSFFLFDLEEAVYAAKIMSYAQGFMLLRAAARQYDWDLNYGRIALMWRGGCIIRSEFLDRIQQAFAADPDLPNLLLADYFAHQITGAEPAWRRVVSTTVLCGVPTPAISSALAFYDGYRGKRGSANLIQAQRDYFGAHTYERTDQPRGQFFHTNWTGAGGGVTAGTYDA